MSKLLAIRYARGQLELLDQRLLPFESTYLPIATPQAAFDAIRDMVVRGAPAIGCTAALAVAAWLVKEGAGSQYDSAGAAAEAVQQAADHLIESRPTAVNLQNACQALSAAAKEAAAKDGATAESTVEAVVAASEAYFAADVATCKAIGQHGAAALLKAATAAAAAAGRPPPESGKLRVLTHCNTGALATAAYGTALGVVRALAGGGHLEHTYCTETRPYNQGSRLTAYELVVEGLPATLIADSAAAALMAAGKVHAVVVGADRIAANGDTANKIGTYSLAVNAAHHRIPFFIAAPVTTIDVDTPNGDAIHIEQRDETELTHFKGQRVAAEGIGVWNPSFDVVPADLLAGIITEHGLVPRAAGGAFAVPSFVRSSLARLTLRMNQHAHHQEDDVAAAPSSGDGGEQGEFQPLDDEGVRAYLAAIPHLAGRLGGSAPDWKVREVGDGNINYVWAVEGPAGSLCLKQGPPYVRVMSSWALSQDRVRIEAEVLAEEGRLAPQHVPQMLHFDPTLPGIAMAFIGPPAVMLRLGLNDGNIYPQLGRHMGLFTARTLFGTSLLALGSTALREKRTRYANDEMCRITEALIFQEPYTSAEKNKWTSPQLDADVEALHRDCKARAAAARLQVLFTERAQALLHGDLHTGSVLVTPATSHVIDAEFATYGPMAFDVGKFMANLLIAFFASDGHATDAQPRVEQRGWLLSAVAEVWTTFQDEFLRLWGAAPRAAAAYPSTLFGAGSPTSQAALEVVRPAFMREVFVDALAFGGACIIRRLVGMAHTVDMDAIQPPDRRAVCERRALNFGRLLLVEGHKFSNIQEVVDAADKQRQDGQAPLFPKE